MDDHMLIQLVNQNTRNNNILDNNLCGMSHNQIIINSNLTDHNIVNTHLNLISGEKKSCHPKKSLYYTDIPLFNINFRNSDNLWYKYEDIMNKISWDEWELAMKLLKRKLMFFIVLLKSYGGYI